MVLEEGGGKEEGNNNLKLPMPVIVVFLALWLCSFFAVFPSVRAYRRGLKVTWIGPAVRSYVTVLHAQRG